MRRQPCTNGAKRNRSNAAAAYQRAPAV